MGMTAAAVARLLGITQSAVTQAAGRDETLANDQRYR
jgi:predicted transcriptional regulator